jgi:hypothetical protein
VHGPHLSPGSHQCITRGVDNLHCNTEYTSREAGQWGEKAFAADVSHVRLTGLSGYPSPLIGS